MKSSVAIGIEIYVCCVGDDDHFKPVGVPPHEFSAVSHCAVAVKFRAGDYVNQLLHRLGGRNGLMVGDHVAKGLRVLRARIEQRADQRAGVEDDALMGEAYARRR